jgi:hypothetical protein
MIRKISVVTIFAWEKIGAVSYRPIEWMTSVDTAAHHSAIDAAEKDFFKRHPGPYSIEKSEIVGAELVSSFEG